MKTIFNCEEFAICKKQNLMVHHFDYDLEKNFFTPYGLMVPLVVSAAPFLRAFKGEFSVKELHFLKDLVSILHINHRGDVWYISIDSERDHIVQYQVTDKNWCVTGFRGNERSNSIAYGHLLKGVPTIEKAAKRMDALAAEGFFDPMIFKVQDVANRLKELELTKPFFYTALSNFQ